MNDRKEQGLHPGKAMIVFSVCNILQKCMPFLLMPILIRLLSIEDYGIYSVYTAWLAIGTTVCTLNLHLGVFNNGMHRFPQHRQQYTVSMIWLTVGLTVITGMILAVGGTFFSRLLQLPVEYLFCMLLQILFQQIFFLWMAKERYEYGFGPMLWMTVFYGALNFLFPVAFIFWAGASARSVIYSMVLLHGVIGAVCGIWMFRKGWRWKKEYMIYALSFNLPLLPHYLSGMVLNQLDRTMIGSMCGTEQAAIYSVAYLFSLAVNFAVSSVNSALVPWTYGCMEKKNYEPLTRITDFLIIGLGVMIAGAVLIMPEVMAFVVTPEYSEAVRLIPPIAASTFFIFLYNLFANVEFYWESKYAISLSSVGAALLNIVLNLWLIPLYGYGAAAYTTSICYGLYALVHFWNMRRLCKKENAGEIYHWKNILGIAAILTVFLLVIGAYYSVWQLRYSCLVILVGIVLLRRRQLVKEIKYLFGKP
ncbi:MAG: oligosaccharide flippase family protein [Massiliimalia sp.]|jgi:O-antigen/teichoic acid export membrane protein